MRPYLSTGAASGYSGVTRRTREDRVVVCTLTPAQDSRRREPRIGCFGGTEMRRIYAGIVSLGLVLAFMAPVPALAATGTFPSQWNMFREQVASQKMIGFLLGTSYDYPTWVRYITFGQVHKTATRAVIPVTVTTRGDDTFKGTLVTRKY